LTHTVHVDREYKLQSNAECRSWHWHQHRRCTLQYNDLRSRLIAATYVMQHTVLVCTVTAMLAIDTVVILHKCPYNMCS